MIYEVNLSVEREVSEEYEAWLVPHVIAILALDGFISAKWYECTDVESDRCEYVVRYVLRDRAALDKYFLKHAERMRRDLTDRFGAHFTATRRVMELRHRFE